MFQLILIIISGIGLAGMLGMALYKMPAVAALPHEKKERNRMNLKKASLGFSSLSKKMQSRLKNFKTGVSKKRGHLSEDYWGKIRKG